MRKYDMQVCSGLFVPL